MAFDRGTIHPMWDAYPDLREELKATVALVEENITIKNEEVQDRIKELLFSGGKLLRPAYSILFSQLTPQSDAEKARAVAAAIEVLHMATLIHDDVIDEADRRRGKATLNAAYSNRVAVYAGDYLFTVSFKLLQNYVQDASVLQLDARGMENILIGELNQMSRRYNLNMRMRDYLSQIQGKTAQLFALSCYAGATQARDAQRLAHQAYQIGNNIGMAFQITDDILDYSPDDEKMGKPVLQDVRNGVYTAPLLYALRQERAKLLPYLEKRETLSEEDAREVLHIVEASGGLREARDLAEKYTKKALRQIHHLPESGNKETLSRITEQILSRSF